MQLTIEQLLTKIGILTMENDFLRNEIEVLQKILAEKQEETEE